MSQPTARGPTRNILITGFGPFPGVEENISGPLAVKTADRAKSVFNETAVSSVHAVVLPTEWQLGPTLSASTVDDCDPDIILHLGVSEKARGFIVETQAANVCRPTPDAIGAFSGGPQLCALSPPHLKATLPIDDIIQRLSDLKIPVGRSDDAGGYLCNAVLFSTLKQARRRNRKVGFVHVPSAPEAHGLTPDRLLKGTIEILRCCLGHQPAD